MYILKEEISLENMKHYLSLFKCQRCKPSCCTTVKCIILKDGEAEQLAILKGMTVSEFKGKYTFVVEGNTFMTAPCPFYKEEIDCTIYNSRPQVCRQFPFNNVVKGKMTVYPCPAGKLIGEKYGTYIS